MKVTLVYSGLGVAGFDAHRVAGDREGSWIGHGIASIGASLSHDGHHVDLIDPRQMSGWSEFTDRVQKDPSPVYLVSVSPVDYSAALNIILILKKNVPGCKVIVGGIHPTIFPTMYNYKAIDCVVRGEGEVTAKDLVRSLAKKEEIPRVVVGQKPDLNSIPWAKRDLFDYDKELACIFVPNQELPSITMIAGRGCAFNCTYCQPAENAVFGKPYRMRSVNSVIHEMEKLHDLYHYRSVTFWDDTFTINPDWVMKWCDAWEKTGIKGRIAVCSRADIICRNEAMVARMAEVGISCAVIGMESGSQRILDMIKKGTTVEQNLESARICHKHGIEVFATFMYGLPTETNEEVAMTTRMIREAKPEYPSPFYFVPIPGTEIYTLCKENDLILEGVEERGIARTAMWERSIRGVDYDFIDSQMMGMGGGA